MASAAPAARVDRKLTLKEVLDWLVADGLVDAETSTKFLHDAKFVRGGARHPMVTIGEARLRSKVAPSPVLTTDSLFSVKTLPRSLGLLGIGNIGIELGLAMARLGVRVIAVEEKPWPAGTDCETSAAISASPG